MNLPHSRLAKMISIQYQEIKVNHKHALSFDNQTYTYICKDIKFINF